MMKRKLAWTVSQIAALLMINYLDLHDISMEALATIITAMLLALFNNREDKKK